MDMDQNKLLDEIQKLRSKLMLIRQDTAMFNQLLDMVNTADTIYQDKLAISRMPANTPDVINIGEIISTVKEYENEEALTLAVVESYTTYLRDNR